MNESEYEMKLSGNEKYEKCEDEHVGENGEDGCDVDVKSGNVSVVDEREDVGENVDVCYHVDVDGCVYECM